MLFTCSIVHQLQALKNPLTKLNFKKMYLIKREKQKKYKATQGIISEI